MKRKSPAQLAENAAVLLQRIVRLKARRAAGSDFIACVTCGALHDWRDMDGGHYISRKRAATKLLEENIHPQCKRCNKYLNGNMTAYALYMADTYGVDFLRELEEQKHLTHKWVRADLVELIAELKQRAAELER